MEHRIVCAAVQFDCNPVVTLVGLRHWDKLMATQFNAFKILYGPLLNRGTGVQGFLDNKGEFLTRDQAMEVVELNSQLFSFDRNGSQDRELYSEGIY